MGHPSKKGAADSFTHKLQQFVTEYCWGTVWCSEGLDRKTRSTINLALLAAAGREGELRLHVRGAINNGLTKDEIAEIFFANRHIRRGPRRRSRLSHRKRGF